ncbi:MAG TPA: Hpt domain-containing protein [Pirellulales bacterium]|nr:Hpt domain-containing protein [Pirellulales bacterium]
MEPPDHLHPRIVDLDTALQRMGGNEELLGTLVQFYFEDSPGLLARVREGVARRDAAAVRLASHTLIGLSSNFGAELAAAAARRLEEFAIAADWSQIATAAATLEHEISRVTEALKRSGNPHS